LATGMTVSAARFRPSGADLRKRSRLPWTCVRAPRAHHGGPAAGTTGRCKKARPQPRARMRRGETRRAGARGAMSTHTHTHTHTHTPRRTSLFSRLFMISDGRGDCGSGILSRIARSDAAPLAQALPPGRRPLPPRSARAAGAAAGAKPRPTGSVASATSASVAHQARIPAMPVAVEKQRAVSPGARGAWWCDGRAMPVSEARHTRDV